MRDLWLGLGLTALVALMLWGIWGREAVLAGVAFGLLATAIQVAATAVLRTGLKGSFETLIRRWAIGMGLRLAGVAIFAVVVLTERAGVPPIPSAIGYVGVLLPLMFGEMRLLATGSGNGER